MDSLLTILLTGSEQAHAAITLILFAGLSWLTGRPLGQGHVAGAAFGFMIVAGSADLAMFTLRGVDATFSLMVPLTALYALTHLGVLRMILNCQETPQPVAAEPLTITLLVLLVSVIWGLRIVQIDPSSSLSSHLGWIPLYAAEVVESGRFPRPDELAAGHGILESVAYVADLQGLVLLAGWFVDDHHAAHYLAASALAAMLAVGVLTVRLRQAAAAVFVAMVIALMAVDPFVRTTLGRQWGDTFLLLCGALILSILAGPGSLRRRALAAAAAAGFTVFSRHYAALYWAVIIFVGWSMVCLRHKRFDFWPWAGLTALFLVDASREIFCLITQPSPWYPGSRQVAEMPTELSFWIKGILHDLGVLLDHRLVPQSMILHLAWLATVAIALGLSWRRRQNPWWLLLPVGVYLLPFGMQLITGYRTSGSVNKLMIFCVLFPAWMPALVLDRLGPTASTSWVSRKILVWCGLFASTAVIAFSTPLGRLAETGRQAYRDHVVELSISQELRQILGDDFNRDVSQRPLIYFYYEPGLALRHYIGGRVFSDFDWYGDSVRTHINPGTDMGELLRRLNCPNLWLGKPFKYAGFESDADRNLRAEIDQSENEPPAWIAKDLRLGQSRFVVTRPEWCTGSPRI